MSIKIFISYCRKDESYKDNFEIHLATLRRSGIILPWNDRDITAGKEWENQIDKHLEEADIIVALISPDFIASEYCFEKEFARAIEKHGKNEAILVPIIVRTCKLDVTNFCHIQALPTDAKPISTWQDQDEAWISVVDGLSEVIKDLKQQQPNPKDIIKINKLSEKHLNWLIDTQIELTNSLKSKVTFDDIYIEPDLKVLSENADELVKTTKPSKLLSDNFSIIYGDEQSGKTSIAKYLFTGFYNAGYLPILINGIEINKSDINSIIEKKIKAQYETTCSSNTHKKAIIIDNFSEVRLNKKFTNSLINHIKSEFSTCILITSESYQYIAPEVESLDSFNSYEIQPFGSLKRSELIEKWISIGREQTLDESQLYKESDEIRLRIESIVRKNVVPPRPVFILMLIQMNDAYSLKQENLSSYGHCYQNLVYKLLERIRIKSSEVDKYINVMTELAWYIFISEKEGINEEDIKHFFEEYRKKYLGVDQGKVISDLKDCHILDNQDGTLTFKYPYIYYFFVAKRITDTYRKEESVKSVVTSCLANLHRQDCANIIIFITHHTKDDWILDEIQLCMMELFAEHNATPLNAESLEFMQEFIESIPSLVMEQRQVEKERRAQRKLEDDTEISREEADKKVANLEPTDVLAKVNKVFKSIEVIGQIVRNRHASLNRDILYEILNESCDTGLRFLEYFLEISNFAKDEIIRRIATSLHEDPSKSSEEVESEATKSFIHMTYIFIYAVVKKVSESIGSIEASEIYDELEEKRATPATSLINLAIQLHFHKNLDLDRVERLNKQLSNNPACLRIMKEIVIQHTYMFPVSYREKQRISEILKISTESQRLMDLRKETKA